MSTHNACFHGEIRKISVLFGWKKCHIWSYDRQIVMTQMLSEEDIWAASDEKMLLDVLKICIAIFHILR